MTIMRVGHQPTTPGLYAFNDRVTTLEVRVFLKDGELWQEYIEGAGIQEQVSTLGDGGYAWSDRLGDDPKG